MPALPAPKLTLEQYFEIDRENEFRSEFIDGEMVAMAGGSPNHGWIISNTVIKLGIQLRGKPCGPRSSDMRVYCGKYDALTFPDVLVTCGPDKLMEGRTDTITDARVIVEVLSPSTKRFDLGEKFAYYRSLPSFSEYLVVWQDTIRAEHHVRQSDGSWTMREFSGADAAIELKSIGCELILGPLYARVQFEAAE